MEGRDSGKGHSTPIVWGDRVFVTAALPYGEPIEPRYSGALGGHDELPVTHRHRFPVGAAGRVYVTDRNGTTVVLRDGDDPEILAVNRLDDSFSASAAVAGRELFLRGERYLYCIAR